MLPLYLLFMIVMGIPALFFLLYLNVAALSFESLGLSPQGAFLVFALSLLGSVINIPVKREQTITRPAVPSLLSIFFYYPPVVQERVLAVNLGGAVVPLAVSLYLLPMAPFIAVVLATAIVSVICYTVARPVPGRGIAMPAMVPPLTAALSAVILARGSAGTVAYIAGTMGTLIGADLMHLKDLRRMGPGVLSIGGAGVYDGIFLAGLIAAFLAAR
ncbi:MAG: DUF1614 domain-containing protein [Bacillota bacterium]